MVGSTPFRLSEAYNVLTSQTERQAGPPQQLADTPVDICAVVLDLAEDRHHHGFSPKIHITLVDESITRMASPTEGTSSITLRHQPDMEIVGSSIVERGGGAFPKTLLSVGDVIRFNRVHLVANSTRQSMRFQQTWDHPAEDGHAWYRLGRFDPHMILSQQEPLQNDHDDKNQQSLIISCWDLPSSDRIPASHQTDCQFLNDLIMWFSQSTLFADVMRRRKQQLDPLPLRQRPLAQVCSSSCVGTRSDTIARRVTHVRQQAQTSTTSPYKRYRRASHNGIPPQVTVALISDTGISNCEPSQQPPIPLVDPSNRFLALLQHAEQRGCGITLKCVQSVRARDLPFLRGSSGHDDEGDVVILCQDDSEILLLEEEEEVATVIDIPQSLSTLTSTPPSQSQSNDQQQGRPNHWMEPSQHHAPRYSDPEPPADPTNLQPQESEMESPLLKVTKWTTCIIKDMMIRGHSASLPRDAASIAQLFLNASLDHEESAEDFPPLRVLLHHVSPNHEENELRWAQLPSSVVQKLCGGVEWVEFCQAESVRLASVGLLLSWWIDQTELEWDFQRRTESSDTNNDTDIVTDNVQVTLSKLLEGASSETTIALDPQRNE